MATVIRFENETIAQAAISEAGFSLGAQQRDDPRGMLHGDVIIAKWRNLSAQDKAELHAVYKRTFRDGPVFVEFQPSCLIEWGQALRDAADKLQEKTDEA